MNITPIKTHKITSEDHDLFTILTQYLPKLSEKSIVVITSKIVSITQGRVMKFEDVNKDTLIENESQFFLPREDNPYNVSFAIIDGMLAPTAGIDESNGNGSYILWPEHVQETANTIRRKLQEKYNIRHIGIVISDSKTSPMRIGVTAMAIAYSGIAPIKNYAGTEDLFGRTFQFEQLNIIDSIATAASVEMGEGSEQMPIAVVTDMTNVTFVEKDPSEEELKSLKINMDTDLYGPFLKSAPWKKGKKH